MTDRDTGHDDDEGELTAVVVARVAPVIAHDKLVAFLQSTKWSERAAVASVWQRGRMHAQWQELRASVAGLERDRVFEVNALMASTGERLGLAIAAGNEVAIWHEIRTENATSSRADEAAHEIQHRAMTELQSYYLLGTGHSLAAIAIRVIALEPRLRPLLLDRMGASCAVGSTRAPDWPSLSIDTCRHLRKVVRDSAHASIRRLPDAITTIVQSSSWQELDQARGEEYHRHRPPSTPVDAPIGRAWQANGTGQVLAIGGSRTEPNQHATRRSALLAQVEELLLEQMQRLHSQLEECFTALMPPQRST